MTLARAGLAVHVIEGAATPGGGCRTAGAHPSRLPPRRLLGGAPAAAASPFFHGSTWRGRARCARRRSRSPIRSTAGGPGVAGSLDETAAGLGADGAAYRRLIAPLVRDAAIVPELLAPAPVRPATRCHGPVRPGRASCPSRLARRFSTEPARALLAGVAAHAMLPLTSPLTGAFGLTLLIIAHSVGGRWSRAAAAGSSTPSWPS